MYQMQQLREPYDLPTTPRFEPAHGQGVCTIIVPSCHRDGQAAHTRRAAHWARIPAAFAAGVQAFISSRINAANSCGEPTLGSKPNFFMAACVSGDVTPALISRLSLFT